MTEVGRLRTGDGPGGIGQGVQPSRQFRGCVEMFHHQTPVATLQPRVQGREWESILLMLGAEKLV